jgi:hypothetical protein
MKQLWTEDTAEIENELIQIIDKNARLFCFKAGSKVVKKLSVQGTAAKSKTKLLVLYHPHEPTCAKDTCMFYYHLPGRTIKFFEAPRVKRVDKFLGLGFPTKIYKIQRRRHARISTPHDSSATFTIKNKQRINYGKVENLSAKGAYITCDLPSLIPKGAFITHLSMTVYLRLNPKEETILDIPEAKVVRTSAMVGRTKELGVQFELSGKMMDILGSYLDVRNIEDSTSAISAQ